jgi:hypothetical protein
VIICVFFLLRFSRASSYMRALQARLRVNRRSLVSLVAGAASSDCAPMLALL